jgi:hypothetical protein
MNDREIFLRAFSFVRDPDRLLQSGDMFEFQDGVKRCCSVGWLSHIDKQASAVFAPIREALDAAAIKAGYVEDGIFGFNDSRSHAEVVALWREVGFVKGWLTEDELRRAA